MSSYASQVWKEILDAPIGATRLLAGQEWEKVREASGSTKWENSKGRKITAVAMYEATINA